VITGLGDNKPPIFAEQNDLAAGWSHLSSVRMVYSIMRLYMMGVQKSANGNQCITSLKHEMLFNDLPSINKVMDCTIASTVYHFLLILVDASDGMTT
jgi:hypothetical protein